MSVLQLMFKSNNSGFSALTFNPKSLLNDFAEIKKERNQSFFVMICLISSSFQIIKSQSKPSLMTPVFFKPNI